MEDSKYIIIDLSEMLINKGFCFNEGSAEDISDFVLTKIQQLRNFRGIIFISFYYLKSIETEALRKFYNVLIPVKRKLCTNNLLIIGFASKHKIYTINSGYPFTNIEEDFLWLDEEGEIHGCIEIKGDEIAEFRFAQKQEKILHFFAVEGILPNALKDLVQDITLHHFWHLVTRNKAYIEKAHIVMPSGIHTDSCIVIPKILSDYPYESFALDIFQDFVMNKFGNKLIEWVISVSKYADIAKSLGQAASKGLNVPCSRLVQYGGTGEFKIPEGINISDKRVLLVSEGIVTGSTAMAAMQKILKLKGNPIGIAVFVNSSSHANLLSKFIAARNIIFEPLYTLNCNTHANTECNAKEPWDLTIFDDLLNFE